MIITQQDNKIICTLSGHFDTVKSEELTSALRLWLNVPNPIVFDMTGVTYICSAFLRTCVQTAKGVGAENFILRNPTPQIKRVFQTAGFAQLFTFE